MSRISSSPLTLDCCTTFEALGTPLWIFDIERRCMWWANKAALALWNADDLQSLLGRDFAADMSESTVTRLDCYLRLFGQGEIVTEQWTFYPNGRAPVTVRCVCSGVPIDDGRLAMLVQGQILEPDADENVVRGIEALRHTTVGVSLYDRSGKPMMRNPAAIRMYFEDQPFLDCFEDKEDRTAAEETVFSGSTFSAEVRVRTRAGMRWHGLDARMVRDPATGADVIMVNERCITKLKSTQLDLEQARIEAEQATEAKSRFLATISHELRTPLNGITGIVELLRSPPSTSIQFRYLDALQDAAQNLSALVTDVLDFSKIEADRMDLETVAVDAAQLVRQTVRAMSDPAAKKGLAMRVDIAPDLPTYGLSDPVRLRQILTNFLSNAIRFTDAGDISVHAETISDPQHQPWLRVAVTDTGIGIAREAQELIFDHFSQGDGSTTRRHGGSGLGLSICRGLVQLMNGRIGVISDTGCGSTFWFEIPFPPPAIQPKRRGILEKVGDDQPSMHFLVAEDNDINQMVMAGILRNLGHTVDLVSDGEAAVSAVKATRYDMVLMDLMMPKMDGLTAAAAIRRLPGNVDLPIVALTAAATKDDREKCLAAGMNGFVTKPITKEGLGSIFAHVPKPPSAAAQ